MSNILHDWPSCKYYLVWTSPLYTGLLKWRDYTLLFTQKWFTLSLQKPQFSLSPYCCKFAWTLVQHHGSELTMYVQFWRKTLWLTLKPSSVEACVLMRDVISVIVCINPLNLRDINEWKIAWSASIWRFASRHAWKIANLKVFMVDKVKGFISFPNVWFYQLLSLL